MQSQYYSNGKPARGQINLEPYRDRLFRYSLRITGNRDDAEDLTQDTFIRAASRLEDLRNPGRIKSWLYKIASRINIDRHKYRKISEEPASNLRLLGWDDDEPGDLDHIGEKVSPENDTDGRLFVDDYISGLKPEHRAILELRAESWPYDDISEKLGIPLGTVKSRLHLARNSLRKILVQEAGYTIF